MNQVATIPRPLAAGGNVMAIIPQNFDDTWRIARAVVMAKLAPEALTKSKDPDEAVSAVAIAIMSGAELGLKPMVALRSFTVINGKPALYGDGLINVIRQSGKAAYLRTGCDERNDKLVGWCEAKRSDTGEEKRVEFSQDDAVRAGLWQTSGQTPWAKYPQRMLAWRAAGWCLRELFGDVLGGIRDEFEAQEVYEQEAQPVIAPPPPDEPELVEDATDIEPEPEASTDAEAFLTNLFVDLSTGDTEEAVMALWDEHDVEATLTHDEDALQRAFDIRKDRLEALAANDFPGDKP